MKNSVVLRSSVLTLTAAAALGVALGRSATPVGAATDAASPAFYTEKVEPIFKAECYRCHAGMWHKGGLKLDSKAAIMAGGHDGKVIVPGDPANSLLIKLIRHEGPADDPMPMPPKKKISDEDIATVTEWVKAGAIMPDDK